MKLKGAKFKKTLTHNGKPTRGLVTIPSAQTAISRCLVNKWAPKSGGRPTVISVLLAASVLAAYCACQDTASHLGFQKQTKPNSAQTGRNRSESGIDDSMLLDANSRTSPTSGESHLKKLLSRPKHILSSFVPHILTKQLVLKQPNNLMSFNLKKLQNKLRANNKPRQTTTKPKHRLPIKFAPHPATQAAYRKRVGQDSSADLRAQLSRPLFISPTPNTGRQNKPQQLVLVHKLNDPIFPRPYTIEAPKQQAQVNKQTQPVNTALVDSDLESGFER